MKRALFFSVFFLGIVPFCFCQIEEKMEKEGVVKGRIFKDGKVIEGYIKKTGFAYANKKVFPAPWQFQSDVKFMAKDVFEQTEKIKNKMYESYDGADCDGYQYDTLLFESLKFSDLAALGPNLIPKKVFMRKVLDARISLYHYFTPPPAVVTGEKGFEPYYEEGAIARVVYRKGKDGKPKELDMLNVDKELADCPRLVEKYYKGGYEVIENPEKMSRINRLVAKTLLRDKARMAVVEEYNAGCP